MLVALLALELLEIRRLLEIAEDEPAEQRAQEPREEHEAPAPDGEGIAREDRGCDQEDEGCQQCTDAGTAAADQARHRAAPIRRHRFGADGVGGRHDAADEDALHEAQDQEDDRRRIQLSLDSSVRSISFVESLALDGDEVPVRMIVVDKDDGRVAYDIIDKRPYRDIDAQGLLLIALQRSGIRLVEIDSSMIDAEPRAANCCRIWRYRDHPVPAPVIKSVVSALAGRRRVAIRTLGAMAGLRDPMPTACALICRGLIAINVSKPLNPNSLVSQAADRVTSPSGYQYPTSGKPMPWANS